MAGPDVDHTWNCSPHCSHNAEVAGVVAAGDADDDQDIGIHSYVDVGSPTGVVESAVDSTAFDGVIGVGDVAESNDSLNDDSPDSGGCLPERKAEC